TPSLHDALPISQNQGITPKETCEQKTRTRKRPRRWRFSIGSAPLTSITKSTLKSEVAKPDRTIKIPGVSPWKLPRALSCSYLSVYWCHSAVMAAFVSFHALHSDPGRKLAHSRTVCTNPPFRRTVTVSPYHLDYS